MGTQLSPLAQQPPTLYKPRPMSVVAKDWMDHDATWYGGRPRPRRHCVRWGPSSPAKKGHSPPIFGQCCGQTAAWIKMPLGTEVGLSPGHIVLDGDQLPKKGHSNPPLGPMAIVAKRLPISAIAELLRHRDKVERGSVHIFKPSFRPF